MKSVTTPYGKAKVFTAEASETDTPPTSIAVIVPGYSEGITHSRQQAEALAAQGITAITFSQPRKHGKKLTPTPIDRQGDILQRVIKETAGGEKVNAVAHSLGAAAVLRTAIHSPELFDSIILMQPAGLVGEQRFAEQSRRVGRKVIRNTLMSMRSQDTERTSKRGYRALADSESALRYSARVGRAQLNGGVNLARQPILAYAEAKAAGSYDMAEDIEKVKSLGIPVHFVGAHRDELFESGKVGDGYNRIALHASSYSSVADPEAGHDTSWMQPARSAKIVSQILHSDL